MSRRGGPDMPGVYSDYYPKEYYAYSTQYNNQIESIGWKLWDTQTFLTAGTTSLPQWFNVRATPDLSNMEVAFQLPAPKAFLIRAIRFFVKQTPQLVTPLSAQSGAFSNIAALINTGTFSLTIGNKQYTLDPIWCLTAGGGAAGSMAVGSTLTSGSLFDYAQNGIADPRAVNTLAKPIFIPPQMNFTAIAQWPAALNLAGGNTAITFLLDGDILRPVQ